MLFRLFYFRYTEKKSLFQWHLNCYSRTLGPTQLRFTKLSDLRINIVSGPRKSIPLLQKHLGSLSTNVKPAARNVDVKFNSHLPFEKEDTNIIQSWFYQAWTMFMNRISKTRSFLSWSDLKKVINAFNSTRLDYCNSLYSGLGQKQWSQGFRWHRMQLISFEYYKTTSSQAHFGVFALVTGLF